ncbi:MAG: dihydrodipicolinate synthase family protein [Pirellulales bacterium]|nr:dihydrodipicolinate synthase family protein [Pirellulales bacterium]
MKSHLTRQTFHGLYAILPTPFDRRGAFSAELFRQMLEVVIGYEINGIVLAGTIGEYVSLEHAALTMKNRPKIELGKLEVVQP